MNRFVVPGICITLAFLAWVSFPDKTMSSGVEWPEYLGGPDRNHYSPLKQIDAFNVNKLKIAWEYHTLIPGQIQCNPIIVNGILYGMTAATQPFALDAATGKEIWKISTSEKYQLNTSRGLTYWQNGNDKRILYTNGPWLIAVNALTGKIITSFGDNGRADLKAGLGSSSADKWVVSNTPGTVYNDLIIMPLRVSDGDNAALGHIQAFNIRTGKLAWVFHTIPHPGEYGYNTWPKDAYKNKEIGGVNNWAGMAIDRKRGIIYVPTGSAANDFYGVNRKGSNLFANCLLALNASTGKRIWHFQFVHHDLLDRDAPAPPNLVTVTRNGKRIDAVAQITKQGYVFVFDRVTGTPYFSIKEKPVPASDIPGEEAWPTQPVPVKPAPYARQSVTVSDISDYAENKEELISILKETRSEGPFTPLSTKGSIIFPGLDGGAEWGGAAADPEGILYVNSSDMPWRISLNPVVPNDKLAGLSHGQRIYSTNCVSCHGPERKGNPASGFPSLVNIGNTRSRDLVSQIISGGKAMMPAFPAFSAQEKQALIAYLFDDEKQESVQVAGAKTKAPATPYQISGYSKFLDKNRYPAIKPPWGTLNAIDLNTGEYVWKVPLGEIPELTAKGIPQTGSDNYGGPVVTASGLLFIAATKDGKFKAYDKNSGRILWQTQLPAAGFATPATYEVNGKQYVVIACGGSKLGAKMGDSYVAYALP